MTQNGNLADRNFFLFCSVKIGHKCIRCLHKWTEAIEAECSSSWLEWWDLLFFYLYDDCITTNYTWSFNWLTYLFLQEYHMWKCLRSLGQSVSTWTSLSASNHMFPTCYVSFRTSWCVLFMSVIIRNPFFGFPWPVTGHFLWVEGIFRSLTRNCCNVSSAMVAGFCFFPVYCHFH